MKFTEELAAEYNEDLTEELPVKYTVEFSNSDFPPVTLTEGSNLSEYLNSTNSPLLFGCRTGLCGTCIIDVQRESPDALHEKTDMEEGLLPILAPQSTTARLACQISLNTNICVQRGTR